MNIPSPRAKKHARIEIVPLIDIVFFLLATFVMVSMSMIKNQGITVQLPIASTSAPQERNDYTTITVTESGEYYFNKDSVTLETIVERFNAIKDADPRVFINGDQKAELGKAVAVLDELRKLGIGKVAIETKSK
jgi:biopolymer transport protein ExbD